MDMLFLKRYDGVILVPLPIHTCDSLLVYCSTAGAVDTMLTLKVSRTGSIPLAWKASEQTCLESKLHGIDSCLR